ncbi:hypothetical protein NUM3379_00900 [Kineococcus sp. NUM-3379]
MAESAAWHVAWVAALDDLELDVAAAEDLLRALHAQEDLPESAVSDPDLEWRTPPLVGPVPSDLVGRARTLAAAQIRVAEELARAVVEARSHLRTLKKFEDPEAAPRFVDRSL